MYCRALACDFDGTVANDGHLPPEVAAVLAPPAGTGAHERVMHRRVGLTMTAMLVAASCAYRPIDGRARAAVDDAPSIAAAVERGALTYAGYCGGCHGMDADGHGPFATTFGLTPTDLRTPGVAALADDALLERMIRGTPLEIPPADAPASETRDLDALAEYLPGLARSDWDVLRAGRIVYDEGCGPCHGTYGRADTAIAHWLGAPDLIVAREHVSDAALARISEAGTGQMPPLLGELDRTELHALIAYIRHLSDGFAVYDTRCASCHGDDGQGIYSDDVIPPAVAAPPLRGAYPRDRLLSMLLRERGVMPHFTALDERRLRDVVAYLRAVVFRSRPRGGPS
jgi:mono/diheme cytochrome c family protein